MAIIGVVCLCSGGTLANAQTVEFDRRGGGASITPEIMRTVQIEVPQAGNPSAIATETGMKPQLLADLLSTCPQVAQAEFYKSLFLANGGIASAKTESIRGCLTNKALETITGRKSRGDDFGKDGYECKCNSSNQLNCKVEKTSTCQEVFCWGACTVKGHSEFGYVDMTRVFDLLPQPVALEFISGFTIIDGKVKKISVSEPILRGLGIEKVAQIMETIMK